MRSRLRPAPITDRGLLAVAMFSVGFGFAVLLVSIDAPRLAYPLVMALALSLLYALVIPSWAGVWGLLFGLAVVAGVGLAPLLGDHHRPGSQSLLVPVPLTLVAAGAGWALRRLVARRASSSARS